MTMTLLRPARAQGLERAPVTGRSAQDVGQPTMFP
jgi:hypothetical protein